MPGQKQNFGFITDFAHHVGPCSLNHFETAKGTLAPSPMARVIGCGCAESRTSPAVGPCCSSKNRSSETLWGAYPGTKIYGVSVPQKSLWYSFWTHRYHERQFGGALKITGAHHHVHRACCSDLSPCNGLYWTTYSLPSTISTLRQL